MSINSDSRLIPPDLCRLPGPWRALVVILIGTLLGYVLGFDRPRTENIGDTINNYQLPTVCYARCTAKCEDVVAGVSPSIWSIPEELLWPVQLPPDVVTADTGVCNAYYCTTFLTNDWIHYCEDDLACIQSCLNLTIVTEAPELPGQPTHISLTQTSPYNVTITWQPPVTLTAHHLVNQVLERVPDRNSWLTITTTTSHMVDIPVPDVCLLKMYKVEAYNQYGSQGVSAQIEHKDFHVPGTVDQLYTHLEYKNGYFFYKYLFKVPAGWLRSDIRGEVLEPIVPLSCRDNVMPPVYVYEFIDDEEEPDQIFWVFRVHEMAYNCVYRTEIRAVSRCNTPGEFTEIIMDFTDCMRITNFTCPKPPYVSPGETRNISVTVEPDLCNVTLTWESPLDEGSEGVSGYAVQWGRVQTDIPWPIYTLEDQQAVIVAETSAVLCIEEFGVLYGVKVAAVDAMNYANLNITLEIAPIAEIFLIPNTTTVTPEENNRSTVNILVPVLLSVVMAAVAIATITCVRRQRTRKHSAPLSISSAPGKHNKLGHQVDKFMVANPFYETLDAVSSRPLPPPDAWELPESRLSLGAVLGRGAFGQVVRGTLGTLGLTLPGNDDPQPEMVVAVKMLHEFAGDSQRQDFLQEMALMKRLGRHANVVSLIGCVSRGETLCLVVEHVPHGDLLHYLRSQRRIMAEHPEEPPSSPEMTLRLTHLLNFARQIAVGMEYLSQKGFVHRDLACRNVMVGPGRVAKIGDFGLTRYIYSDKLYVAGHSARLPLRWMALEAMEEYRFTTETDVWSYGVVLFELVTLGGTPYPTIHNRHLLKELKSGYRMEQPDNCTDELYSVMCACWASRPGDRPTFFVLRHQMEGLLEAATSTEYLDLCLDQSREYYRARDSDSSTDTDDNTDNTTTEVSPPGKDSGVDSPAGESSPELAPAASSPRKKSNPLPILFHLQNSRGSMGRGSAILSPARRDPARRDRESVSSTERLIPGYSTGSSSLSTTDSGSHSWLGETIV